MSRTGVLERCDLAVAVAGTTITFAFEAKSMGTREITNRLKVSTRVAQGGNRDGAWSTVYRCVPETVRDGHQQACIINTVKGVRSNGRQLPRGGPTSHQNCFPRQVMPTGTGCLADSVRPASVPKVAQVREQSTPTSLVSNRTTRG